MPSRHHHVENDPYSSAGPLFDIPDEVLDNPQAKAKSATFNFDRPDTAIQRERQKNREDQGDKGSGAN